MATKIRINLDVIDAYRKLQDWTDSKFAEECGVDQSFWSMIRNNKRTPSLETLEKIIDRTGIEIGRLLTDAPMAAVAEKET